MAERPTAADAARSHANLCGHDFRRREGFEPDLLVGWALRHQTPDRVKLSQAEAREGRAHGIEHVEVRPPVGAQSEPQKFEPDPMLLEHVFATANSSIAGRWSGSSSDSSTSPAALYRRFNRSSETPRRRVSL